MARALKLLPLTLVASIAIVSAAEGRANPTFGRTAWVKPVSGTVLLRERGRESFARLRGERTIPLGSAVDAGRGRVRVTTARNRRGDRQSGVFNGGTFKIAQKRGSALTELTLMGDDGCATSAAGGVHAAGSRRRLFGNARGRFRTRGRSSSATVRGTVWATEDLCSGATVTRAYRGGKVDAKSRTSSQTLEPGQSSEDYCDLEGAPGVSDLYCISLFSDPAADVFGFAIATFEPGALGQQPPAPGPRDVDVCIRNPRNEETCRTDAMEQFGEGF